MSIIQEYLTGMIEKSPLHGGDINEVSRIQTSEGFFVLKENKIHKSMFRLEAKGLETLSKAGINTPTVIAYDEYHLLLEYLKPGRPDPADAGRQLAGLHQVEQDSFGLEYDNFIGSIIQANSRQARWSDFFFQNRILRLIKDLSISSEDLKIWQRLRPFLDTNLPHNIKPRLLHGDLWSGNLYYANKGAFFIDPAIYFGDRCVELAFTQLFGGLSQRFYDAYHEVLPIPDYFYDLKDLYNIYPLLVHARLFGGNYYQAALSNLKKYIK